MKSLAALLSLLLFPLLSWGDCTLALTLDGTITAATTDYLARAEKEAEKKSCESILLRMNTPGGDLQSTRKIVEKILNSKFPFLCLVTPSGGHAGSAGAIILQACHVNGGVAATNIGAATPVLGGGASLPEDLRNKIVNDTVGWSQSLARLRGRNDNFAKEIVTEAKVVSSEEAVKSRALDFLARDENDFLGLAMKKKVQIQNEKNQTVIVGPLIEFQTDLRYRILDLVSDPQLVYLLFMISLGLLYFELTHPGFFAPGVIGAVGLVLSLIAFNKLEVQWGGLALIVLGIGFLIAEIFVPSFGALGIGGLLSLIVGSIFLFDPEMTGYRLPLTLIFSVSFCLGALFLGLGFLAFKTYRRKKQDWDSEAQGKLAQVVRLDNAKSGQIEVLGEIWKFQSEDEFQVGDRAEVLSREGLVFKIKKP